MKSRIEAALREGLSPSVLEVTDESESHRGHAGYQEGGESHWHVRIAAPAFKDMSRIQRHRSIHAALGPEIIGAIHALRLTIDV